MRRKLYSKHVINCKHAHTKKKTLFMKLEETEKYLYLKILSTK